MWQLRLLMIAVPLIVGLISGWEIASWRCDSEKKEAIERAVAQFNAQAAQDREVMLESASEREKIRIVYRTIRQEVERVKDNPDCRVGDDFKRVWNMANQGRAGSPTTGR